MIHVIYRWRVQAGQEATFAAAWTRGTDAIRQLIKGAQGSLLVRSQQQPTEFIAIAQWESLADWQAFSRGSLPDDEALQRLSAVSTMLSTEVCEEVYDLVSAEADSATGHPVESARSDMAMAR
ncbi:MAG: antibiotic biosynthesis monooxygenase [Candidatus Tectimicrobiota bacterium]